MFIRLVTVKGKNNGRSRRYAQLVESFRRARDKRPAHRVLANLGSLSDAQVDLLRRAFAAIGQGAVPVLPETAAAPLSSFSIQQNLAYLDIAVAYQAWCRTQVPAILAELAPPGDSEMPFADVIGSLVVHRCVAPDSKKGAERWFPTTALPELLGVSPGRFHNTRVHRELDTLDAVTDSLQARLPELYLQGKPHFSAMFLDVTDTWFVGRGAPLAEKAITKEGFYRYAVGIVLLCNEHGYPLRWQMVAARSADSTVMSQMLEKVRELDWIRHVPLVMDRAMGTTATLRALLEMGLHFITALTTTEFDAYTAERLPSHAVAHIDAQAEDAVEQAADAIAQTDMRRVSDTRYVLDLGVVERQDGEAAATQPLRLDGADPPLADPAAQAKPPPRDQVNPASQALALAEKARSDVEQGRLPSYRAAARSLAVSQQRLSEYLGLLKLAPDLQEQVRACKAHISPARLCRIASLPDHEAQRRAYADNQGVGRPAKQRPRRRCTAASHRPPPAPVRVRAVVCFNPRLFVDARRLADETLAKIRSFERTLNEQLQSPRSRRTRESVEAEINSQLRHRNLLDAFEVHIEQRDGRVVRIELQLLPDPWWRRRRFDGFSVVVAHPDSLLDAAQLAALYREKDQIEKSFRTIKSEIELRPMWHRTDAKVRSHVTLCMLALLVDRLLERTLEESGHPLTAHALYELLEPVHLNRCRVEGGNKSWYRLTDTTPDHDAVLKALSSANLTDHGTVAKRITPR